jgi:hypothetical protein
MRRRVLFIGAVVLLILVGGGYWANSNQGDKTIEGAIEKTGRRGNKVIYQEKVNGGVVVFTKRITGNANTIDAGYVKKGLLGWKWIWGGGFSGYSGQYFQAVSGTPFPMLIGDINNEQTAAVKIIDTEHKNSKETKIVGSGNDRVWFTFLDKSDGPAFEIITYSNSGNVLDTKNINIRTNTNF